MDPIGYSAVDSDLFQSMDREGQEALLETVTKAIGNTTDSDDLAALKIQQTFMQEVLDDQPLSEASQQHLANLGL